MNIYVYEGTADQLANCNASTPRKGSSNPNSKVQRTFNFLLNNFMVCQIFACFCRAPARMHKVHQAARLQSASVHPVHYSMLGCFQLLVHITSICATLRRRDSLHLHSCPSYTSCYYGGGSWLGLAHMPHAHAKS